MVQVSAHRFPPMEPPEDHWKLYCRFFCLKARLVVELDGSQHYDENGLVEYDQIRTEYLEALELKVLRFTNSEIEHHFSEVCRMIQSEVRQRSTETAQEKGGIA